jgi:hypothetical protein
VFHTSDRLVAFVDGTTILVLDIATGECVERLRPVGRSENESWVSALAISDNGKLLATAGAEGVKLWDMPRAKPIEQGDGHALLNDLKSKDAKAATRAVFGLAADPRHALPLLREGLPPARPVPEKTMAKLLADLDGDSFPVRQRVTADLKKLEKVAEPALRNLLASRPSLEVRRRAEKLLAELDEPHLSAELLFVLRGVEVLERMASPEARKVLEELAAGQPEARLTQEARAALERLTRLESVKSQ